MRMRPIVYAVFFGVAPQPDATISSRRCWSAAIAPSPTAPATRLIQPCRTSPAANTLGTLVSRMREGSRRIGWGTEGAGGRLRSVLSLERLCVSDLCQIRLTIVGASRLMR